MKKSKIIATTLVLLSAAAAAHATVGTRTGELAYNNIKIMLDGKEVVPKDSNGNTVEPFIIDGTTYLPVRGISSALGLDVEWDSRTNTVKLSTPGGFTKGVTVYNDEYVTIEFTGCNAGKPYSFSDTTYYYANFNVKNKTNFEITLQPDSLSFNGLSYNSFMGSEAVAPQSTGQISFYTQTQIPTSGINKTSGQISVIDFSYTHFEHSYDATWVDVKN